MSRVAVVFGVAAIAFLAGCIGGPNLADATRILPSEKALTALTGTLLNGQGCELSVGMSVFPGYESEGAAGGVGMFGEKVGPFYPADAREDAGPYTFSGGFFPLLPEAAPEGDRPMTGFWHTIILCDDFTSAQGGGDERLQLGAVMVKIKPPEVDMGGADAHYYVSTMSMSEDWVWDNGLHAFPGIFLSDQLDRSIIHTKLGTPPAAVQGGDGAVIVHGINDDKGNGHFEWNTWHHPVPADLPAMTIRLWQLVPVDGINFAYDFGELHEAWHTGLDENEDQGTGEFPGEFYPVTWDLKVYPTTDGSAKQFWTLCACGTFRHTDTHSHEEGAEEPAEPTEGLPIGGAGDPLGPDVPVGPPNYENGMYWTGFDYQLSLGPRYDVTYDVTMIH